MIVKNISEAKKNLRSIPKLPNEVGNRFNSWILIYQGEDGSVYKNKRNPKYYRIFENGKILPSYYSSELQQLSLF